MYAQTRHCRNFLMGYSKNRVRKGLALFRGNCRMPRRVREAGVIQRCGADATVAAGY